MTRRLYTVYDVVAASSLGTVIAESADAPAIRAFNDALANSNSLLGQHPADFNLLYLGELDESGEITPVKPETIATGKGWLQMKEKENGAQA